MSQEWDGKFQEKRRQHDREMSWLVNMALQPLLAFMVVVMLGAVIGSPEWWFQIALEKLIDGVLMSVGGVVGYLVLSRLFGFIWIDGPWFKFRILCWDWWHLFFHGRNL